MQQQSSESKSGLASKLWRISKVLLFIAPVLGLGSLNVLTLINDQAHAAGVSFLKAVLAPALAEATMSRLLSHSPTEKYGALEKSHRALESKHVELKKVSAARSQVVKNISTRVARRAVANAGKNVASYAAEVVPVIGVAAITALTISDIYDDCQTLKDISELNVAFEHETTDDNTVCGIKFP
ncbi:MAG: hypothetical protein I8H82_06435 [Rhodocyclales bacterium]|jgi:hypothetical protein|nr:hypothetical protein [Rhodocyclales bacterium]MBH1976088.1 hypothetical protein [Rhodocyclales bacterium]